ncbi:hypothetical protein OH76DRAFT_822904 [Lentinus brumalis]|uniref:Uncharacterized protein n=1 Tax=Lentinus brumalis TaxID=2498619 RepID=A0A371D246_9APHY|nr:hypothetical protein OH76DRAFT_822904 [Polyporus brumalis]
MVGAAAGAGPRGTTSTNEESVRMRRRKRLGKRRQQIKGSPGRSLSWHGAMNLIAGRGGAQACHSASIGHPRSWLSPNDTPQVYRSDVHLQPRSRPRLPRTQPSTSPPGASLCFAPAPHRPSSAAGVRVRLTVISSPQKAAVGRRSAKWVRREQNCGREAVR